MFEVKPMICPNCGAQLPDTAKMCFSCRSTIQNAQESERIEALNGEKRSGKGMKKLYVLLVSAVLLMAGLFYTYMVINGNWRLPFQKKDITYTDYKIFDFCYAVPDEWEGDGRLNADERTYFRFKYGQYMISREILSGPINEEARDSFLEGVEKKEKVLGVKKIFFI